MGMFKGAGEAKAQRDSDFIRPGRYLCRIESVKVGETRKKDSFVVFNLLCLHVIDDTAAVDDPKGAHHAGDYLSWMIMQRWDSFLTTVKTAVMRAMDVPESEVTEEALELVCGSEQPLAGLFLDIDARNVTTDGGGAFTRVAVKRSVDASEAIESVSSHIAEQFELKPS